MSLEMIIVYAHWCPICNMMMPIAEELEIDYREKMRMVWIDVQEQPEVFETYGIEVVPTFIIRCNQKEIARMSGMIGENILRERIEDEIRLCQRTENDI